ncbi:hypothetical protein MMC19_006703 [Ptychographa xylographoides]|nr:hypothetical protein [Ptychographa xylographoides]
MSANVLSARDINTSAPKPSTHAADGKGPGEEVKSMEYHRQLLHSKLAEDGPKSTYVSPSDNIMSPTTAKLAGMKQKRFMSAKPQSLFAKTSAKNMLSPPGKESVTFSKGGLGEGP